MRLRTPIRSASRLAVLLLASAGVALAAAGPAAAEASAVPSGVDRPVVAPAPGVIPPSLLCPISWSP
jgi:hypothetical protein